MCTAVIYFLYEDTLEVGLQDKQHLEEEVISIAIRTPHKTHDMFAGNNMGKYISFFTPANICCVTVINLYILIW
jgi:hypothetical protein